MKVHTLPNDEGYYLAVWIGSNNVIVWAHHSGRITITEFGVTLHRITTALDVLSVAKNIAAHIAGHRTTFKELTAEDWLAIGHDQVRMTTKPTITQTTLF